MGDTDQKKIALVTGASRGIGRAIAEALGKAGMVVVGTATSESGADNISQYLESAGIEGAGKERRLHDCNSGLFAFSRYGVTNDRRQ